MFALSIMVATVDVPLATDSCETLEMGEVRKRRRIQQLMEEFNPMMQKPDLAGSYNEAACKNIINTSVQRVTPSHTSPPTQ